MEIAEYALKMLALLSALIGVWVAVYNIDAWRREHQGKRQAELAEEVLALFYEAIDIISIVRSPGSWEGEVSTLTQRDRETDVQFRARRSAYVVFKRFSDHEATLSKLHALRFRFMAVFGRPASKPFDDFQKVRREITLAGAMLSHLWARRAEGHFRTEEQASENEASIARHEKVFWEMLPEDDPIKPKLDEIASGIEKVCRSVIEAHGTLYSLINKKL